MGVPGTLLRFLQEQCDQYADVTSDKPDATVLPLFSGLTPPASWGH